MMILKVCQIGHHYIYNTLLSVFRVVVTLSFEQIGYAVIEGDIGSLVLNVCVVSDSVVTRDGIVGFINSFQFAGEAEGTDSFES